MTTATLADIIACSRHIGTIQEQILSWQREYSLAISANDEATAARYLLWIAQRQAAFRDWEAQLQTLIERFGKTNHVQPF